VTNNKRLHIYSNSKSANSRLVFCGDMRGVVFGAAVLRLAMIAAAVFDDHSEAELWHMQVRPDFGLEARLPAQWDRCFLDCVCVIRLSEMEDLAGRA